MVSSLPKPRSSSPALPPAIDLGVFRQMADMATEGFYLLDRRGRFLYVNAQAQRQMGGYTTEELLKLTVSDICPDIPPEQFAENVAALAHGPLPVIETWTRRKDGTMFPVAVSMARLEYGGEVYLFGVASDVTRRKADDALRTSLAAQLLHTLETERQRVARELHDDVGQALATVGILLDTLDASPGAVPDAVKPTLAVTRTTIARIGESLARIVREYHPAELLGLGLEDTLRSHVRQFAARHELAVRLATVPVEGLLAPEQELHVYRIVQEALANTARHARAKSVHVTMRRSADRLEVGVGDDGVGFDSTYRDHPPDQAIGHLTMRDRATLLRGDLAIETAPGQGTTVRLSMPLASEGTGDAEPASAAAAPHERVEPAPAVPAAAPSRAPTVAPPLPPALGLEVFRRMADMSSEVFRLADRHGRFVYVNDCACTFSGFSREEELSMTVSDMNPDYPPGLWEQWVADSAQGPLPPFETRNRRKDGTLVPVEVSAARIDTQGEPYFFAVVRDLRERKETERAQKGFTRRLLHTLEAERRRVARELHDEVGQAIATVGVLLHALESTPGSVPGATAPEFAATHATIRQITESVARIVRDYHPAELLGLGLEDALRTHAHQFAQRHRLTLRLATVSVDGLLSDQHAVHLYRIVQEALANVARHARARRVSVRLARRGRRAIATVRDDGIGFETRSARPGGLGLVTMRERASLMGAALEVRSRPGRGTEVRLAVTVAPVPSHE